MTQQELMSLYLDSTTSQQGIEPCRILPAPQVTVPDTEAWFEIFQKEVGKKFPREIIDAKFVLGDVSEVSASLLCTLTLPVFFKVGSDNPCL